MGQWEWAVVSLAGVPWWIGLLVAIGGALVSMFAPTYLPEKFHALGFWLGVLFVCIGGLWFIANLPQAQQLAEQGWPKILVAIFGAGLIISLGWWALDQWGQTANALSRGLQYGLNTIYQEDSELTFKEIADRWERSAPDDRYKANDVLQWLVGDMWLGKFEDEDGNSVLQFIPGFIAIDNGEDRTYLRKQMASLNRHRAFCFFARDSRLFDEVFMGKHQEMKQDGCEDWQAVKALAPWDILSKIEPRLYDDPSSNTYTRRNHFRRAVLEGAILKKEDFSEWLKNTKHKKPDAWSTAP